MNQEYKEEDSVNNKIMMAENHIYGNQRRPLTVINLLDVHTIRQVWSGTKAIVKKKNKKTKNK